MSFLFNKKKKKEEEDYEDYEEESSTRKIISNRDIKDLKPENKKFRKEPKKPWGRKERAIVFITLLISSGIPVFLALSSRNWKLPGLPRIAVPSISIPFIGKKTIELGGSSEDLRKTNEAKKYFVESTKSLTGVYGLYVIRLKNGSSYGVNENLSFQAASLIKLPVIVAFYMNYETQAKLPGGNTLDLTDKYILKASDKVSGSGSLYGKPAGYQISYQELLNLMGKQSDNTAFNIIRRILGDTQIDEVTRKMGMSQTSLSDNQTSPYDIGTYFESLWRGNIVSEESKENILDSLTDTIYEDWMVKGIPEGIEVAHKFGREINVVNDAGIIMTNDPYILVLMGDGIAEREANLVIPEVSKKIYEIETGV